MEPLSLPSTPIAQPHTHANLSTNPSPHSNSNSNHEPSQHSHHSPRPHSHSHAHSHSSPLPPRLPANTVVATATITGPAAGLGGYGPPSPPAAGAARETPGRSVGGAGVVVGGGGATIARNSSPGGAPAAALASSSAVAAVTAVLAAAGPPPSPGRGVGLAVQHVPTPPGAAPPPSPRATQLAAAAAAATAAATAAASANAASPPQAAPPPSHATPPPAAAAAAAAPPAPPALAARRFGAVRVAVGSALDHGVWDSEGLWQPSDREHEVHIPPHLQRINAEDIVKVRELGRGCFGSVWLARWRGVEVALKELLDQGATDCPPGEIFSEAERLASLRHPCVIAFYGIVAAPGLYATVVEYLRMGSLKSGLSRLKRQGADISRRLRVAIALQAARGMEYLHGQFVVHFDLKCDNLLCDLRDPARPVVKIGDLGLSKKKKNSFVSGNMRGTLPWMAPELFPGVRERQRQQQHAQTTQPAAAAAGAAAGTANGDGQGAAAGGAGGDGGAEVADDRVNEKVDVFSFGICMWEIWQLGEQPYSSISLGDIFAGVMTGSLRPGLPPDCDPDWAELMQACWHGTPRCRPSFSEISDRLDSLLARFTALEGSGGSTGSGQGGGSGGGGGGGNATPSAQAANRRF